MNLTRIRASNFTTCIDENYKFYGKRLRLIDQDLLNVYFHFHNRELYYIYEAVYSLPLSSGHTPLKGNAVLLKNVSEMQNVHKPCILMQIK